MAESASRESLAEKTRIYIDAHPSIKDCVAKGLINYSSLARMIMKDLELENEEAVMIACRRYASKLSVTTDHELSILSILKDSRLEMRTKTCIVTAKNDWTVLHKMDNLFKDMWNENSIMQCVQSASAVTIIADRMLKDRVIDTVGRFNLIKIRENLVDPDYIRDYTEGFEELKKLVNDYTSEKVAEICNIDPDQLEEAARMYACAKKAPII